MNNLTNEEYNTIVRNIRRNHNISEKGINYQSYSSNSSTPTISKICMRECKDRSCPTNQPYEILKKYNLIHESGYVINPQGEDTFDENGNKNGWKPNGHYILKEFCMIKVNGKEVYDKPKHIKMQETLAQWYKKYTDMINFKNEFGHIGYLNEVLFSENIETLEMVELADTLHDNRLKLCCPYCGSTDILTDQGRKYEEAFNAEDDYNEWNIDCIPEFANVNNDVKEAVINPVMERYNKWKKEMQLDYDELVKTGDRGIMSIFWWRMQSDHTIEAMANPSYNNTVYENHLDISNILNDDDYDVEFQEERKEKVKLYRRVSN